ncbi:hypothetical protein MT418_006226 [Batrachochytrium dendrobatidis]
MAFSKLTNMENRANIYKAFVNFWTLSRFIYKHYQNPQLNLDYHVFTDIFKTNHQPLLRFKSFRQCNLSPEPSSQKHENSTRNHYIGAPLYHKADTLSLFQSLYLLLMTIIWGFASFNMVQANTTSLYKSNTISPQLSDIVWGNIGTKMTLLGNFTRLTTTLTGLSPIDFTLSNKQLVLSTIPSSMLAPPSQLTPSGLKAGAIASYSSDDRIASVCRSDTLLFMGGKMTTLSNHPTVSNVFALNLTSSAQIIDLNKGLSTPVSALACIGNHSVWAVSSTATNASTTISNSTTTDLLSGYIAIWSRQDSAWTTPTGKGLDGPVNDIKVDSKGVVYLAGKFSSTADGSKSTSPTNQIVSITSGNVIAPGAVDAGLLSCPSKKNGWVMPSTTGIIEFQLGTSVIITAIAIQNLVGTTDGVKTFSVISPAVSPGAPYKLAMADTSGVLGAICTVCTLPRDENMHVFYIIDPEKTAASNDVQIIVISSYGLSTSGLATIQFYQRDIVVWANPMFNAPSCSFTSNKPIELSANLVGPWTILHAAQPMAQITITGASQAASSYATFKPNIIDQGMYTITAFIPACALNTTLVSSVPMASIPQSLSSDLCTSRGNVTVAVVSPNNAGTPQTVVLSLQTPAETQTVLGTFLLSPGSFFNISCATSTGTSVAIEGFTVVKTPSVTGLKNLASFATNDPKSVFTPFAADAIPDNAVVKSLAVDSKDVVYVAGQLYIAPNMANIVKYTPGVNASGVRGWSALSGGGLNAGVSALASYQSLLFVGGDFTGTQNGLVMLSRVAIYNSDKDTWLPMSGGINAAPTSISVDSQTRTVRILGPYTLQYTSQTDTVGVAVPGMLVWSIDTNSFISPPESISGILDVPPMFSRSGNEQETNMIAAGIITDFAGIAKSSYGVGVAELGVNGVNGLVSIPDKARLTSVASDTKHGVIYMAGTSLAGVSSISSMQADGSKFYYLGVNITAGEVRDMVYFDQSDMVVLCGSFKSVTIRNVSTPVSGLVAFNPTTLEISKSITFADSKTANQTTVNVRRIKVIDTNRFVVLGDIDLPSLGCIGACIWDASIQTWSNILSGVRGTYQAVDVSTNGVVYFGGKFTVNNTILASATPTTTVSILTLSPGESLPKVQYSTALSPIDLNGNVTSLGLSLNGVVYIAIVDRSGITNLTRVNNGQIFTYQLNQQSVVTEISPMGWNTSSGVYVDGMLLTGRIITSESVDGSPASAKPFVAALYDPTRNILTPLISAIPSTSVVSTVRVQTPIKSIPPSSRDQNNDSARLIPIWALVLIVIAALIACALLFWMIYICVRNNRNRKTAELSIKPADKSQIETDQQSNIQREILPARWSPGQETIYTVPNGLVDKQDSNDTISFSPKEIESSYGDQFEIFCENQSKHYPPSSSIGSLPHPSNEGWCNVLPPDARSMGKTFPVKQNAKKGETEPVVSEDVFFDCPDLTRSTISSDRAYKSETPLAIQTNGPYRPPLPPHLKCIPQRRSGSLHSYMAEHGFLLSPAAEEEHGDLLPLSMQANARSIQQPPSFKIERVTSISTFEDPSSMSISILDPVPSNIDNVAVGDAYQNDRPLRRRSNTNSIANDYFDGDAELLNMSSHSIKPTRPGSWLVQSHQLAIAQDSYHAQDSTELNLHTGDKIEVLDCTDPFWWTGRLGKRRDQIGLFPASLTSKDIH